MTSRAGSVSQTLFDELACRQCGGLVGGGVVVVVAVVILVLVRGG